MYYYNRVLILILSLAASHTIALTPDGLMCELLAKPGLIPITDASPDLSWGFKDGKPGDYQSAYQIQAATATSFFRQETPDLWDSGKIDSQQSLYIKYSGTPLPINSEVCWRVRVWDKKGKVGPWSVVHSFKTANELGPDTSIRYPLEQKVVPPVSITTNRKGRAVVDFGRSAFGWIELVPPYEMRRGGPFTLRMGEKLKDGSPDDSPGGSLRYAKVLGALTTPMPYRVPLPMPPATHTSPTDAPPLLTTFGTVMPLRYVEVEEAPCPITTETIRQTAIYYPYDKSAVRFVSSSPNLDKVFNLCKYTIKATSFAGLYLASDHHRHPCQPAAYVNQLSHYSSDREFTLARYTLEHFLANLAPEPEWEQSTIMMAWNDWMHTGNLELLKRNYEKLKEQKLTPAPPRESDGLLVSTPLPNPSAAYTVGWPTTELDGFEFKPVNTIVNAYYCLNLRQLAEMAAALDNPSDASLFHEKSVRAQRAFHTLFFNTERGCYIDGEGSNHASLHANMLPLAFDLVPEAERQRVAQFVELRRMACNPIGAQFLLQALFEANLEDYALHLLTRHEPRGWLNMLQAGATTTAADWDDRLTARQDWNHAGGTAPLNIITRYVMGVRPLQPGFGKILIRPQIGSLTAVEGYLPTVRGTVRVGARQEPGTSYTLTVELPYNTTAQVELPTPPTTQQLYLDNKPITPPTTNGRYVIDDLPSGRHTITWGTPDTTSRFSRLLKSAYRWLPLHP